MGRFGFYVARLCEGRVPSLRGDATVEEALEALRAEQPNSSQTGATAVVDLCGAHSSSASVEDDRMFGRRLFQSMVADLAFGLRDANAEQRPVEAPAASLRRGTEVCLVAS